MSKRCISLDTKRLSSDILRVSSANESSPRSSYSTITAFFEEEVIFWSSKTLSLAGRLVISLLNVVYFVLLVILQIFVAKVTEVD